MWLLACTPASESTPNGDEPSGYEQAYPDASWTKDEVADQFALLLGRGVPEPITISETFTSLFDGRDAQCPPGSGYSMTGSAGCMSQTGWFYAGDSSLMEDGSGGFVLACNCYVIDPVGQRFIGGGQLEYLVQGSEFTARMDGTWGYEGQAGWLGQTPSFNYSLQSGGEGEDEHTVMQGGLGYGDGTLYFEEFGFAPFCDGPFGTVKLRDPSGWWYSLEYGRECSGCGQLFWGEENMGELCLGFEEVQVAASRLVR